MKKEQGFTLIELLIVVAIIAIIAAIAIPNLLTARMAANEAAAIAGLRTIGSAELEYSIANNGSYADLDDLVAEDIIDARFSSGNGFNGYEYAAGAVVGAPQNTQFLQGVEGFLATPISAGTSGRYVYGMGTDYVIRYQDAVGGATAPKCGTGVACTAGDPVGLTKT